MFTKETQNTLVESALEANSKINKKHVDFKFPLDETTIRIEMETAIRDQGQAVITLAEAEFSDENYNKALKLVESLSKKRELELATRQVDETSMGKFITNENYFGNESSLGLILEDNIIKVVLKSNQLEESTIKETKVDESIYNEGFLSDLLDALTRAGQAVKDNHERQMKLMFESHDCHYIRVEELFHESWIKHFNKLLWSFDRDSYSEDIMHFKLMSEREFNYECQMAVKMDKFMRKELRKFDAYCIHSNFVGHDRRNHILTTVIGHDQKSNTPIVICSLAYLKQIKKDGTILVPPIEIYSKADRGYIYSIVQAVRQMSGCLYRN